MGFSLTQPLKKKNQKESGLGAYACTYTQVCLYNKEEVLEKEKKNSRDEKIYRSTTGIY